MLDRFPRSPGVVLAAALSAGLALLSGAGPDKAQVLPVPAAAGLAPTAHGQQLVRRAHAEGSAQSVTDFTSNNWDGYFATAPSHGTNFTAISATWTVAPVTCGDAAQKWVGFWVGLDGWWNNIV